MTPEFVTETAVGLLADCLVMYAVHHGGEVDITDVMGQMYNIHASDPDAWDQARGKCMPLIQDLFVAYLNDSQIDIHNVIAAHTNRINGNCN